MAGILNYLGGETVSEITADRVVTFREWRLTQSIPQFKTDTKEKRTYSRRTVNMEVGALATMLNYGVKRGLVSANPIRGLKPLKVEKPFKNRRPLTLEEIQAILIAATDHYRPIWRALLSTGMRIDELGGLRFKDVDWGTRELIVRSHTAKNHTERRIPIEDADVWADLLRRPLGPRDPSSANSTMERLIHFFDATAWDGTVKVRATWAGEFRVTTSN